MPDIFINHASLTTATDDLNQSQTSMVNALEDFIGQLAPHLNNTEGQLKAEWQAVHSAASSASTRAHNAMQNAVTTLGQIHDDHKTADAKGAQIMGG